MSTILKSLKKLEEEKSVLDKNLDLKGLVVQDEKSGIWNESGRGSRGWKFGLTLIMGGIFLGGIMWSLFDGESPPPQEPGSSMIPLTESHLPPPLAAASAPVVMGVPLSNIQEPKSPPPVRFAEPQALDPIPAPAPAPVAPPVPAVPNVSGLGFDPGAALPEDEEDRQLAAMIEKAKAIAAVEPEPQPTGPVAGTIPGLQLKGIIFFDDNSAANYIFYSTGDTSNRKLKIGESVLAATLQRVEPGKAIFEYQGKPLAVSIGN